MALHNRHLGDSTFTTYSAEDYDKGFQYGSKEDLYDFLVNSLLKGKTLKDDKEIGVKNYSYNLAKNTYDSLKGMYPEGAEIPLSEVERLVNRQNPDFYSDYAWSPNTNKIGYMFGDEYSELGKLFDLTSRSFFNDNTDIRDNPLAGLTANTPEEKERYIDAILAALRSGEYTRGSDQASKNNILRSYIDKNYQSLQPKPKPKPKEQVNIFDPSSYDLDPYKIITKEDTQAFNERARRFAEDLTKDTSLSRDDKHKVYDKIKGDVDSYVNENKRRKALKIPIHLDYIMQQAAKEDEGYDAEAALVRQQLEEERKKEEFEKWRKDFLTPKREHAEMYPTWY